jgi:hypothetical protein
MKLTDYVLALMIRGDLSKEAGVEALAFNKEHKVKLGEGNPLMPANAEQLAKYIGLQLAVSKGVDVAGKAMSGIVDHFSKGKHDAVFQQLIAQHPALEGKDPLRAKANFDYLLAESPHLIDHPLILGDHVANMTSMGTSDLNTTKTIADIAKAKSDIASKKTPFLSITPAGEMAGNMYLAGVNPPPTYEQRLNAEGDEQALKLQAKALGHERALTKIPEEVINPVFQKRLTDVMEKEFKSPSPKEGKPRGKK